MANSWTDDDCEAILRDARTIAVVGLSNDRFRPSYGVARYLQQEGYKIIPVNPHEQEILGETCYPNLRSVPEKIDVVDVFRRPEFVPDVVAEAIEVGAKAIWLQAGIWSLEAGARARDAGLRVVMDRCMATELRQQRAMNRD